MAKNNSEVNSLFQFVGVVTYIVSFIYISVKTGNIFFGLIGGAIAATLLIKFVIPLLLIIGIMDYPLHTFLVIGVISLIMLVFQSNSRNNLKRRTRFISQEVKHIVFERDGGRCSHCGSGSNLEYDHIVPFSRGGSNEPENIQLLCLSCNRRKKDN